MIIEMTIKSIDILSSHGPPGVDSRGERHIMKSIHILLLVIFVGLSSALAQRLPLSTTNDSAKYYYDKGWDEVMNNGNYSASEVAFRKMYAFDSSFVLGKALLGRISDDAAEQVRLIAEIDSNIGRTHRDERLLVDLYSTLVKRRVGQSTLERHQLHDLALGHLGTVCRTYTDDTYYFAEYIEWINAANGSQGALDSIGRLASDLHQQMPFIIGYKVALHAELKQFDLAEVYLRQLENQLEEKPVPKVAAVKAGLLMQQNKPDQAKYYIDRALALDPKNLDVQQLKNVLNNR